MPDPTAHAALAARLADAWRAGSPSEDLQAELRPRSLADAYDIQDRFVAALGHPVVGWKIGISGRSAYRAAGLDGPIFGQIVAPRLFRSDEEVPVPAGRPVTIELEYVLILARDIEDSEPLDATAIATTHLGLEIVSSRAPNRAALDPVGLAADNGINHAVVLGDRIAQSSLEAIAASSTTSVDGRQQHGGLAGDDLPLPLDVLGHLARHVASRGRKLHRGDVIFTGTMIKPFDVTAPVTIEAESFGARVGCRLRPSS